MGATDIREVKGETFRENNDIIRIHTIINGQIQIYNYFIIGMNLHSNYFSNPKRG